MLGAQDRRHARGRRKGNRTRMTERKVLIIGATGNYGTYITQNLIESSIACRILTRDPNKAERIFGRKAEIVKGDLEDLTSLRNAFLGIDCLIFSVSAFSIAQIRRFKEIEQDAVIASINLASEMGITRLIYISIFEANRSFAAQFQLPFCNEKANVEEHIAKSKLNWTIFGCPPTMDIFFRMIRGNNMMVPGGGPRGLPTVSPYDVGEIVKQAVSRNDLGGKRIQLVAPRTYSFPDAAQIISEIWGRPITFRKIPLILPILAYHVTGRLKKLSDRLLYVHNLLSFIRLLNRFPEEYMDRVPVIHNELRQLFDYSSRTLEIEARNRMQKS